MPVDPNTGEFWLEDRQLQGGLRQDMAFSDVRYTAFRNVHVFNRNAISKRKGYTRLNSTDITGSPDILGGIDAHFSGGTQKVLVFAGTDAWLFNNATRTFTAQSETYTANAVPSLLMFANNLIVMNGSEARKYSGSAWSAVGGSPPLGGQVTIHNNRLVVAGVTGTPYQFFYSGVRNEASWDTTNDVVLVTVPQGEEITGVGQLGTDLIVFTRHNTLLYWQNPSNKGDWDRIDVSNTIGNIAHHTYTPVTHLPFGMGIFWSEEGPFLIYRLGDSRPVLRPLWEYIYKMVQGVTENPQAEGLLESRFANIVGGYQPSIQELRFGVTKAGGADNNMMICFDMRSMLAFVAGQIDAPSISIKDNNTTDIYPCDRLFQVRTDTTTGLPSTTGVNRLFGARDGAVYQLDNGFDDNGQGINMYARKSGYAGAEDGIGEIEKVLTSVRVSGTQNTNFGLVAEVTADGGFDTGSADIDLDSGLGAWNDGGEWTSDPSVGTWNGAVVRSTRGDLSVRGKVFELSVYDQGAIDGDFQMDRIALEGLVYERQ